MKLITSLRTGLLLAATTLVGGAAANADVRPMNGGVIILLRADTHFHIDEGGCDTLVIVSGDHAVHHLAERLESEGDVKAVRVEDTRLQLKLTPVDDEHLTGRTLGGDRPVMVVSRDYARTHHLRHHVQLGGGAPQPAPVPGQCLTP